MGPDPTRYLLTTMERLPGVRGLAHAAYGRYFAQASGRQRLFRGAFPDFESARASAPRSKPVHYDDSGYGYAYNHRHILASDYPVLLWLSKLLPAWPSVLDFGGNVGMAFYAYQKYLSYPAGLDWLVYDLPEIVAGARRIRRKEGAPLALRFTSRLSECQGGGIFLAAGSLQYVPETLPELLSRLPCPPEHLIINKLPLTDETAFVTLQNTGTAFCPYRVARRSSFLESLTVLGYELVDSWRNPDLNLLLPDAPSLSLDAFSGLYLRLAAPAAGYR